MAHFYITQVCINCLRGQKTFQVDLDDADGKLPQGVDRLDKFQFMCRYCWRKTKLDFYKFSHPQLICYLKQLHQQLKETKKILDELYFSFSKIKC